MVPLGDATGGSTVDEGDWTWELSQAFGLQFPLWLDVGYRIDRVFLGAYGQYAFGLGPAGCGMGYSCSGNSVRVGFEVQVHPFDTEASRVDPWFGAGFGYEWATARQSLTGSADAYSLLKASTTYQGWDVVRLGFGIDFGLEDTLALGPFLECSLSQFQKVDQTLQYSQTYTSSYSPQHKTLHYWFVVGLKLTWRP